MFLALCWIAMVAQGEPGGDRLVSSPGLSPAREHVQRFEALHSMLSTKLADTADVVLVDVDGDGDLDLYVASKLESLPSYAGLDNLYLNDGTGVFTDATVRLPENTDATGLGAAATGDVDGDGDPDLVLATRNGFERQNRMYLNDGKGWFTDGTAQLPADTDSSNALALGDVDGDDDLDVWFANNWQDRLLLNDGLGNFVDATDRIPVALVTSHDVQLGDVDCDGDLDVVLARSTPCDAAQNQLYLNDGDGYFSDASYLLPVDSDPTLAVALGDVNGDDYLDIVFANLPEWGCDPWGDASNRLYLNDRTGAFTDASNRLTGYSAYTRGCVLEDLDGDDDLDIWFANSERPFTEGYSPYPLLVAGEQNRMYLNDGSGFFTEASDGLEQLLDASSAGAVADVDGDGDPDLVVGNDGANGLLLGDGQGELKTGALPMPHDGVPACSVALGDVDRDGVLDTVLGRGVRPRTFQVGGEPVPDDNRLYLGDGAGGFVDASDRMPGSAYRAPQVALGDVDRDHDLDLLLAFPLDGEYHAFPRDCELMLNDGMGNYTDASDQLPWFGPGDDRGVTNIALLVDVNCDGAADIFLGGGDDYDGGGGGVDFFLNDGSGNFTDASSQVGLYWVEAQRIEVQDVNGDHAPDLIVAGFYPSGVSVLLNDRNGVFHDTGARLPDDALYGQATALTLGDADGDGHRDLFSGWSDDMLGHRNRLYLNDGKGSFTESLDPVPQTVDAFRFSDVDGDGDQDLLGTSYLFENDGRGRFRAATASMPADTAGFEAMALGDLDGDGDVDALVAREAGSLIWSNLTRHLAWRGEPRLGQPLVLDVFGPAGEPWILLGSLATCDTVTAWGVLHLDPAGMFTAGQGILPPSSRADVTFQIPTLPAWLGLTVHWQALVGTPARLTNLENTTFSDL